MADNTPIGWVRERLQRNDLEREPLSRIVLPIHMSFPGARVHLQNLMLHTESTIPGAQVSPVHGDSFCFLQKGKGEKIENATRPACRRNKVSFLLRHSLVSG